MSSVVGSRPGNGCGIPKVKAEGEGEEELKPMSAARFEDRGEGPAFEVLL